jgi:tripartite-type tricarboxylate transporter receptor subunit TctC
MSSLLVTSRRCAFAAVAYLSLLSAAASGQESPPNRGGRTVTIYVGTGAGSGYDLYARVFARHWGNHLPGRPALVVSNMPGAATIRASNYLYSVVPKDGSAVGIVAQSIAEEQLLGTAGVKYDVTRFNWIGRFAPNIELTYVWHSSRIKSIDDLKRIEATFAGTGPSSLIYPRLLNAMAGMKWKVVQGYNTTPAAHLALQRGEVDGATSSLNTLKTTEPDWLENGLVRIIVQLAQRRSRELPLVPAVVELATNPEDRDVLSFYAASGAIGRALIAPPDMASDRVAMLRKSFDETMRDRDFLADITSTKLAFEPLSGAELQTLVIAATKVSEAVLQRARAARGD